MKNERIRQALKDNGLREWELADLIGVSEASVTRMMRHELKTQYQDKIIARIMKEGKKHEHE